MDIKNKKILVTGAHGFVGKNLILELKNRGYNNLLTPNREECNFTNELEVSNYFKNNKPNIVFHLAGKNGGIGINKEKIAEFYYENTMINTLVINYSSINNVEKIISFGAGCAYPKFAKIPLVEEDYWNGFPNENLYGYSMAKRNLVIQSMAYKQQHNLNSTVLLPANLYGPYDNFNNNSSVIPALIEKFINAKYDNKKFVEIWGSGVATREFLYVKDAVDAIINSISCKEIGPINLGNGVEVSIKQLVETISEIVEYKGEIIWDKSKADGQLRRVYDMSKFRQFFGYIPKTKLYEGLKLTIDWYIKNKK
jgi:GDP-L-fucose synthase